MAGVPKRATACELALTGQDWNRETAQGACEALLQDFEPISDWRASAGYRMLAAQNLLQRFYIETTDTASCQFGNGHPVSADAVISDDPDPGRSSNAGVVHSSMAHDSAVNHVTGKAVYVDDIREPSGLLHVYVGTSAKGWCTWPGMFSLASRPCA